MLKVFENNMLRKVFGPKRAEITEDWRRLHNEGLHHCYSSTDVIREIKSRRMRWEGHVACREERRGAHRVLAGKPKG
jgi:hypothetical protein